MYYVYRQCAVALLAISKGYLVMSKQNKKPATAATTKAPAITAPKAGMVMAPAEALARDTALQAWAAANGAGKGCNLVIGNGRNPNATPNQYKAHTDAGKRKVVLLNNAMAGQKVSDYYKKAKEHTGNPGQISINNPRQAAVYGLVTLWAPGK